MLMLMTSFPSWAFWSIKHFTFYQDTKVCLHPKSEWWNLKIFHKWELFHCNQVKRRAVSALLYRPTATVSAYSVLNRLCRWWPVELWLLGSSIPTSRSWFIHLLSWGLQGDKPSKFAWGWGISWDPGLFSTKTRTILGKPDSWSSEEMSLFWKHMQGGKRSLNARCWHCFAARMLALY